MNWILLFCLAQGAGDIPLPDKCEVLGLFNSALEAVEFGRDYCMDDFNCMVNLKLNRVHENYEHHPL